MQLSTMNQESSVPLQDTAPTASIEARLAHLETFDSQMSHAVDDIVTALLETREELARHAAPAQPDTTRSIEATLTALQVRVLAIEQQFNLDRCCRDLTEVSRSHPKTRSVIFMGGRFFGDNVKYTYLAFREVARAQGIDVWYLPFNGEVERTVTQLGGQCLPHAYTQWSSDDVTRALSAAVLVTSDHLLCPNPYAAALLAGARHVQLWHGVSIKEVGYRNLPGLDRFSAHTARVLRTSGHFASFVGSSPEVESDWRRWFGFDRYSDAGYPRNDVLHRPPTADDLVNADVATYRRMQEVRARKRPVYVYAPTFRDAAHGSWMLDVGIDRVAHAVKQTGGLLVVNLHPVEQPLQSKLEQVFPSVSFVRPDSDLYPLLTASSALVTDYSSLMFDYLHLDRPVVLFRPDHEAYVTRSRKLFDGKLDELPGLVVTDADDLAALLRKPSHLDREVDKDARRRLYDRMFSVRDGTSAQQVCEVIGAELTRALAPRSER